MWNVPVPRPLRKGTLPLCFLGFFMSSLIQRTQTLPKLWRTVHVQDKCPLGLPSPAAPFPSMWWSKHSVPSQFSTPHSKHKASSLKWFNLSSLTKLPSVLKATQSCHLRHPWSQVWETEEEVRRRPVSCLETCGILCKEFYLPLQECWLLHLFIQIAGMCELACSSESPCVLPFLVDFLKELQDGGNVCLLCDAWVSMITQLGVDSSLWKGIGQCNHLLVTWAWCRIFQL